MMSVKFDDSILGSLGLVVVSEDPALHNKHIGIVSARWDVEYGIGQDDATATLEEVVEDFEDV
ncbi:MAG: hypothetical protein ACRYGK_04195 [Janthinobacterium lividum]